MSEKDAKKIPAAATAGVTAPSAPVKKINDWTSDDKDCPDDIVINAGVAPLILGAIAHAEMRGDAQRINVGDRRQGAYYVEQVKRGVGIARVKDVPKKRLAELEKIRAIREGDQPADWILEARAKRARGEGQDDGIPARFAGVAAD